MTVDLECETLLPSMVTFTVYGEAKPAGSKRAFVHNGRAIVTDANSKSKPWKQEVAAVGAQAMRETGRPLFSDALAVSFAIFVPRPKSHYGRRGVRSSAPSHPSVRPDVLKLARGIEDGLSGVVWKDDAQIVDERIRKMYGEPARVEVTVAAIGSLPPYSPLSERTTP